MGKRRKRAVKVDIGDISKDAPVVGKIKYVVKEDNSDDTDLFPLQCGLCSLKFKQVGALYSHFESSHKKSLGCFHVCEDYATDEKVVDISVSRSGRKRSRNVYSCNACHHEFTSICALHKHFLESTGEGSYQYDTPQCKAYPLDGLCANTEMKTIKKRDEDGTYNEVTAPRIIEKFYMDEIHEKAKKRREKKRKWKNAALENREQRLGKNKKASCMNLDRNRDPDFEEYATFYGDIDSDPYRRIRPGKKGRPIKHPKLDDDDYKVSTVQVDGEELTIVKNDDQKDSAEGSTLEMGCEDPDKKVSRKTKRKITKKKYKTVKRTTICEICGKELKSGLHRIHMLIHDGVMPFSCDQCDYKCEKQGVLNSHIKAKHTEQVKSHQCDTCSKKFPSPAALRYHEISHSLRRPFACDKCPAAFKTEKNLKGHLLTHSTLLTYECEQCLKLFKSNKMLQGHIKRCHSMERFPCDLCDQVLMNASSLKNHRRRHTGDKPYICEHCGASFIQRYAMRTHKQTRHNIPLEDTKLVPAHWNLPGTQNTGNDINNADVSITEKVTPENEFIDKLTPPLVEKLLMPVAKVERKLEQKNEDLVVGKNQRFNDMNQENNVIDDEKDPTSTSKDNEDVTKADYVDDKEILRDYAEINSVENNTKVVMEGNIAEANNVEIKVENDFNVAQNALDSLSYSVVDGSSILTVNDNISKVIKVSNIDEMDTELDIPTGLKIISLVQNDMSEIDGEYAG